MQGILLSYDGGVLLIDDADRMVVSRPPPRARSTWCSMFFVTSLCAMAAVQAEIYRWQDAEGGTHFGDSPPADVRAEPLTVLPQPSDLTPEQATPRLRDEEAASSEADEATEAEAATQARQAFQDRAAALDRCEHAKWALVALDSGRPVYRDEQGMYRAKPPPGQGDAYTGERTYLDGAARDAEIDRQQELIATHCETPPTPAALRQTAEAIRMAETCEKAAADHRQLSQPEARASQEALAASRAFMRANCGP